MTPDPMCVCGHAQRKHSPWGAAEHCSGNQGACSAHRLRTFANPCCTAAAAVAWKEPI